MLPMVYPPKSATPLSQWLTLYAADALPPCRWKESTPLTPGLACRYEYPTKTSTFGVSCARAVTPNNESTANKDTTSFNFINPPVILFFAQARKIQARPHVSRCALGRKATIRNSTFCLPIKMRDWRGEVLGICNIFFFDL